MPQQIPNKGANARTLDTFKSKLLGGGVRPNFFEVEINFPALAIDQNDVSDKIRFLVKGANLPASIITPISIPFRGRELKIAGERSFDTWTVTVINDNNFTIRDAMEKWMNLINKTSDNAGQGAQISRALVEVVKKCGDRLDGEIKDKISVQAFVQKQLEEEKAEENKEQYKF